MKNQPRNGDGIKNRKMISKINFILLIFILRLDCYTRFNAFLNIIIGLVEWLRDNNRTPLPNTLLLFIISPLLNKLTTSYITLLHALLWLFHANYILLAMTCTLHYNHSSYLNTFAQLSSKLFLFKLLHKFDHTLHYPWVSLLSLSTTFTSIHHCCPQYTLHFLAINSFFFLLLHHIQIYYQQFKLNLTGSWDLKPPKISSSLSTHSPF